jgi:hypothetical protein
LKSLEINVDTKGRRGKPFRGDSRLGADEGNVRRRLQPTSPAYARWSITSRPSQASTTQAHKTPGSPVSGVIRSYRLKKSR